MADGYLRFEVVSLPDGGSGTMVYFDRDGFGSANPWPAQITTLDHILPSGIHSGDILYA